MPASPTKICNIAGCRKPVVARGMCDTHRKRHDRHGHVLQTRPADWGARDKHSAYETWASVRRAKIGNMCPEWATDFWKFVEYMGNKPEGSRLFRERPDDPFGPGNAVWAAKSKSDFSDLEKVERKDYMKRWRDRNIESVLETDMKRRYGVSFDQYAAMLESQNGVCAICGQSDCEVDNRNGKFRRLAIDHCHDSGKVRGLLCSKCNKALGGFRDSVYLLEAAIAYLKKSMI